MQSTIEACFEEDESISGCGNMAEPGRLQRTIGHTAHVHGRVTINDAPDRHKARLELDEREQSLAGRASKVSGTWRKYRMV